MTKIAFADFPVQFRGSLFRASDAGYAEARTIYNSLRSHDQPALIAQCADEGDVVLAMQYASNRGIPVSVRSGGHGVDGTAMAHDQLVVDLTRLKTTVIEPTARRMRIGAGVLLGELDAAAQAFGLVVPAGTVSTTGAAGLTLGGGVGHNMRRFGATVDNLLSCDVVTVDGRRVRASLDENPDLFWALRGGGGNFGVVTSFEYRAHSLGPNVLSGVIVFPIDQAQRVMQNLRENVKTAPRELGMIASLTHCPPVPAVSPMLHGQPALILVVVYTGALAQGSSVVDSLAGLGTPSANLVGVNTWLTTNRMLDEVAPTGRRVHTTGGYASELSDQVIATCIQQSLQYPVPTSPGPTTAQNLWCMGGAISEDFDEDSTAFSREGAGWFYEAVAQWDGAENDARFIQNVNDMRASMKPLLRTNGYVNLSADQGPDWLRGLYGSAAKYQRLLDAKTKWDPHNMLRFNKNFKPNA